MSIIIKIEEPKEEKPVQETMFLRARKTLDGNLIIFDHIEVDVVVMPNQNKVVVFSKEQFSDKIYETQNRLFNYLRKKGVIDPGTVQGGNVYGSLEGMILESVREEVNPVQVAIHTIGKFIKQENEDLRIAQEYEQDMEDRLLEPTDEDSTELGEIPHEERKGSLDPNLVKYPHARSYMYRM